MIKSSVVIIVTIVVFAVVVAAGLGLWYGYQGGLQAVPEAILQAPPGSAMGGPDTTGAIQEDLGGITLPDIDQQLEQIDTNIQGL